MTTSDVMGRGAPDTSSALLADVETVTDVLGAMSSHAIVDADGTIMATNVTWQSFGADNQLGPPTDSVGVNYFDVCADAGDDEHAQAASAALRAVLDGDADCVAFDYPCHSPTEQRWFLMRISALKRRRGAVIAHIDITDRKVVEARFAHESRHDELTGLPNRKHLFEHLDQVRSRIAATSGCAALLFIDLDRFKVVNDSLGHSAGDELLLVIAERLRRAVRPHDLVARLGGDEFVIVCDDITGIDDAARVADRVAVTLDDPARIAGKNLAVTASVGITLITADTDPGDALRDADTAMYRAKASGRAGYRVFDAAIRSQAVEALSMATLLRDAIAGDELDVRYAPVVDLSSGSVCGGEALVCWTHPERGLLPAAAFLDDIEAAGLTEAFTRWSTLALAANLERWALAPELATGSVRTRLPTSVLTYVKRGANPIVDTADRLGVSLSVDLVVNSDVDDAAVEGVDVLRSLGVRVFLAEFGTAAASPELLTRLPIDGISIAGRFTKALGEPVNDAVVASMISLAHSLGQVAHANDVTTRDQHDLLRQLGCDFASGPFHGAACT